MIINFIMCSWFDDSEYNTVVEKTDKIIENKNKIPIKLLDVKIGDNIYIQFHPYSQKYIYSLYPKVGIVNSIENYVFNGNEFPSITITNSEGNPEELFHGGVSYFGDSLGYDYSIYLIE